MRLTHLGSSSPVSIHFVFIHVRSSSFTGVVSVLVHGGCVCLRSQAVVFVHGQGSCPGHSSFMQGVVIVRIVVCGHHVIVRGW